MSVIRMSVIYVTFMALFVLTGGCSMSNADRALIDEVRAVAVAASNNSALASKYAKDAIAKTLEAQERVADAEERAARAEKRAERAALMASEAAKKSERIFLQLQKK